MRVVGRALLIAGVPSSEDAAGIWGAGEGQEKSNCGSRRWVAGTAENKWRRVVGGPRCCEWAAASASCNKGGVRVGWQWRRTEGGVDEVYAASVRGSRLFEVKVQ